MTPLAGVWVVYLRLGLHSDCLLALSMPSYISVLQYGSIVTYTALSMTLDLGGI